MARPSTPIRRPPPRTLGIDSLHDLGTLHDGLRHRWTLPRVRIALRLPMLDEAANQAREREFNRTLAFNAWPAGAAGALLLVVVMLVWPEAYVAASGGVQGAALVLSTAVGWWLGKSAATLWLRQRLLGLCRRVGQEAQARLGAPGDAGG